MEDLARNASDPSRSSDARLLLRQLFRDEFENKKSRIPPIKGKETIAILSILALFLFGLMVGKKFNRMVTMEESVLSTNGLVINALQRRTTLFSTLVNLTLNQAALEQEVFRHVADVRKALMGGSPSDSVKSEPPADGNQATDSTTTRRPPQEASSNATGIDPAMAKLLAVVEQYPNIKSSTTYQQLMDKLVEIEDRIIARRAEYNNAVRDYNTYITTFPQYILADIVGFRIYKYSSINKTIERDVFHLDNLNLPQFQRLLPLDPEQSASPTPGSGTHRSTTIPEAPKQ